MTKFAEYLKQYTFGTKIKLFLEEYLWPLFSILPGYEGMCLRRLALRLICSNIGRSGMVYRGVRISHAYNIKLGNEVNINNGAFLDGRGGIEIGDYCLIGPDAKILTSNHVTDDLSAAMTKFPCINSRVVIEKDVWIGAGAIITPGVTLKEGCVVGAGAVVTKDTEPYSLYAGIPANFIRRRKLKNE